MRSLILIQQHPNHYSLNEKQIFLYQFNTVKKITALGNGKIPGPFQPHFARYTITTQQQQQQQQGEDSNNNRCSKFSDR